MPSEPITDQIRVKVSSEGPEPDSRRCGLIQCRKEECNLRSHRLFVASRSRPGNGKKRAAGDAFDILPRLQPTNDILDRTVMRIERHVRDVSTTLPSKHDGFSTFRPLAHHYFSSQIDRLIQTFSPHLDRRKYKSTMVEHALSNDVFCVCITANAKTDMLMRNHVRVPDRASEIVYATTASTLRQKLNNFRPTDIDWLLVLVVALVGFDLAFDRQVALKGHHQALKNIIQMKGGVHNVGHTLPYVLNTERFLACFTGSYPIFTKTPLMPVTSKYAELPGPYGAAFHTASVMDAIDEPVRAFCLDECHFLHVMETCHVSLMPKDPPTKDPAVLPYYLYLRDRLAAEGACFLADYHENQNRTSTTGPSEKAKTKLESKISSKSRCVVLAVLIIDYIVAHGNYYTVKGPFLAEQLLRIIDRHKASRWEHDVDLLLWLLVAAAMPEQWHNRASVLQKLKHCLGIRFPSSWPGGGWKSKLKNIMKEFVWSERLESRFERLCVELVVEGN